MVCLSVWRGYGVDKCCSILNHSQMKFQSLDSYCGPLLEILVGGNLCRDHIYLMNTLASSHMSVSSLYGIKCLIFVSLLATPVFCCSCLAMIAQLRSPLILHLIYFVVSVGVSGTQMAHAVLFKFFTKCGSFLRTYLRPLASPANNNLIESTSVFSISLDVLLPDCLGKSASDAVRVQGSRIRPICPDRGVFNRTRRSQIEISFSTVGSHP